MYLRQVLLLIALLASTNATVQHSIFIPNILIENSNCSDVKTLSFSPTGTVITSDKNNCFPVDKHLNSTHSSHVAVVVQKPPMIMTEAPKENGYEITLTLHMSDRTYRSSFTLAIGDDLKTQVLNLTDVEKTSNAYILAKVTGMVVSTRFEEGHVALAIAIIESILIAGVLLTICTVKLAIPVYRRRREDQQFSHQNFGNDYSDTPSMLRRDAEEV